MEAEKGDGRISAALKAQIPVTEQAVARICGALSGRCPKHGRWPDDSNKPMGLDY